MLNQETLFQNGGEELLKELGLAEVDPEQKLKLVETLAQRFESVTFKTTLGLMNDAQRLEYLEAVKDPDKNGAKIEELASQVEGLAEEIEAAWLFELESLKHILKK
ncbi:MAG: hypothetical protein HY918_02925 [Candidatus Doudnabacteria bacterium]|nr:hypothetical protein [Candidatus Doudnabacteria bacterium]